MGLPEFETSPNAGRQRDWRTPERVLDIPPLWITSFWVQLALLSDKCVLNIAVTEGKFLCECVDYKFYCKPCLAFQATLSDPNFTAFPHCSAVLFQNLGWDLQERLLLRRRVSFACAGDFTGGLFSFPYCNRVVKGVWENRLNMGNTCRLPNPGTEKVWWASSRLLLSFCSVLARSLLAWV